MLENVSLKISNYKCFGETKQGFDEIKKVNVIIGRNNVGKSALIDLVENAVLASKVKKLRNPLSTMELIEDKNWNRWSQFGWGSSKNAKIEVTIFLDENNIGLIKNHQSIASFKKLENRYFSFELIPPSSIPGGFIIKPEFELNFQNKKNVASGISKAFLEPNYFLRLASNRDVFREPAAKKEEFFKLKHEKDIPNNKDTFNEEDYLQLSPSGQGATQIIKAYLINMGRDDKKIKNEILNALNEIFVPDCKITDLQIKFDPQTQKYEICLNEDLKGNVLLSDSGSGLKTIILVLINLILIPDLQGRPLSQYVFAFEELENNLHPDLERRLLMYLKKRVQEDKFTLFLSTHSHIAIDVFSNDENAQIIHVEKQLGGNQSIVKTIDKTFDSKSNILDDLGVLASDLLQSNCLIWVEGPSDRIYIKRWLEIHAAKNGQEIIEGVHYRFILYGGSLLGCYLSEYDKNDTDGWENEIHTLKNMNRNLLFIADSDRESKNVKLKDPVQTAIDKIGESSCWVTEGYEIEHYIPQEILKQILNTDEQPDPFKPFSKYWAQIKGNKHESFPKVKFAKKVIELMPKEDTKYEIPKFIGGLYDSILEFNSPIVQTPAAS